MSSKRSVMTILVIPILIFSLRWQPVYADVPITRNPEAAGDDGAGNPSISSPIGSANCDRNQTLPCDELDALTTVLGRFTTTFELSDSHCQNSTNWETGAVIRCDCSFKENKSNINICHITEINMISSSLSGSIDEAISGLQHLQILQLYSNQLSGSLPKGLGNLTSLEKLDLSHNQLRGSIPNSFQYLKSLYHLDLSSNYLAGPITILGNLQDIGLLDLSSNFFNQHIPASFGNLSFLQILVLRNNMLSGPIPDELGNLSRLRHLALDDNELSGQLPQGLGKLGSLKFLWLMSNYFTGNIPQNYSHLNRLKVFSVAGNDLSGFIPDYVANWKYLKFLYLLGNNFEGSLTAGIFKLPYLEELWVSGLRNRGFTFPNQADLTKINSSWIDDPEEPFLFDRGPANLTNTTIHSLVLRNCSINGTIPEYIANWTYLMHLDLSFNNLIGGIPKFDPYLTKIFLTRNKLNGTFPSWMRNTTEPEYGPREVDVSLNDFTNVPDVNHQNGTLSHSPNTIIIEPRSEYLSRKGKECPTNYNSLSINCGGETVTFDKQNYESDTASSNFYESPHGNWAYSFVGNFSSLRSIDAMGSVMNLTCGVSLPEAQLYISARVAPISLTYYAFCLRKGKYVVQLYFAETLFSEEENYSILGKRLFDVYIQEERVLQDFNIKKEAGGANKNIMKSFKTSVSDHKPLKIDFFWVGKGTIISDFQNGPLISAISITRAPRKLSAWEIAAIAVACFLAMFILLAFSWRMGWIGDRELHKTYIKLGMESYSVKAIIDATQKFSPKTKIGKDGRFGIVYRAQLPNLTVAVKKLFPQSKAATEIRAEVFALSQLDNPNLVKLLGSYSKRDLHLLIYEYMDNGSLEQVLFGPNSSSQLSWETRYNICQQIALGLEFLHGKDQPIIHRNIKASNILLDGNSDAKISDFGLAKLYEEDNPFMFAKEGSTLVYMAPEYASHRNITVKVDVYSFGILLLEIVSGIKIDKNLGDHHLSFYLLDKADKCYKQKRYEELIDETLKEQQSGNVSSTTLQQAITIIDLAMLCTEKLHSNRPLMSDVVSVLQGKITVKDIAKKQSSSLTEIPEN